jgi:hypothetical protein
VTTVAVIGDGASTTALALAAVWPSNERVLAEFDPAGGCFGAWLDLPRSPGLAEVAAVNAPTWDDVAACVQHSRAGVDVLVAPARATEAAAVVHAATRAVLRLMSSASAPLTVIDGGRARGGLPAAVSGSAAVVVCHRQQSGSAAAAALGLGRVAEIIELLATRAAPAVVALIGDRPYGCAEVARFLDGPPVVAVADDPWAASVLAGRAASATRVRRSPLMSSVAAVADAVMAAMGGGPVFTEAVA